MCVRVCGGGGGGGVQTKQNFTVTMHSKICAKKLKFRLHKLLHGGFQKALPNSIIKRFLIVMWWVVAFQEETFSNSEDFPVEVSL